MELRERMIETLRTTELWRDMDGIGTLDTYGPADADYEKLADAAIAAVLDALMEPSEGMLDAGKHTPFFTFERGPEVDKLWTAMLQQFRRAHFPSALAEDDGEVL